ncbi:hypothetical protein [Terribacillus saccharophilus]|uniref:hypothetical protein n=1 Tax=Terribacillus saccharophilus TaxID=361277 RepID=UPI003D2D5D61
MKVKHHKRKNKNLLLFKIIDPVALFIFFILYISVILLMNRLVFEVYNPLFDLAIGLLGYLLIPDLWARTIGNFYLKRVSRSYKDKLEDSVIIRYTNNISEDDLELYRKSGYIRIKGVENAATNYVADFDLKREPFIWFHLCKKGEQPSRDSLLFNHLHEMRPRKYKITINPKELNRDNVYIRPSNNNVAYRGDILVKGEIETEFDWSINSKLHLLYLLKGLVIVFHPYYHLMRTHQFIGTLINIKDKRIKKIDPGIKTSKI